MSRADTIAKTAIAVSRRRQLARMIEALELMTAVKPRSEQEAVDQELAIQDLLRRNNPHPDSQPTA